MAGSKGVFEELKESQGRWLTERVEESLEPVRDFGPHHKGTGKSIKHFSLIWGPRGGGTDLHPEEIDHQNILIG